MHVCVQCCRCVRLCAAGPEPCRCGIKSNNVNGCRGSTAPRRTSNSWLVVTVRAQLTRDTFTFQVQKNTRQNESRHTHGHTSVETSGQPTETQLASERDPDGDAGPTGFASRLRSTSRRSSLVPRPDRDGRCVPDPTSRRRRRVTISRAHVASQVESGEARENRFVSRIRPVFRTRRTPISSAPRPAGTIDGVDGRGAKACGGRASHTCDKRHTVTASRLARVLICSCQISLRAPRTLSMPAPSAATQAASRPKTRDSRPRRNRALRRPVAS